MTDAAQHSFDLNWFYNKVRPGGAWDYKRQGRDFEGCGNFNYGAAGTALGVPDQILLRAAGGVQSATDAQKGKYDPNKGFFFAASPYGDNQNDQPVIINGINRAVRAGY
jgi:hypothetical protein